MTEKQEPTSGDFLTIKEAAADLSMTVQAVHTAIYRNVLPFALAYGRKVIARADLDAYKQRTRPDGEKPKGRPRKER